MSQDLLTKGASFSATVRKATPGPLISRIHRCHCDPEIKKPLVLPRQQRLPFHIQKVRD